MLKCGVIAVAVLGLVGSSRGESPTPPRFPWFDPSLPTSERAQALVKAIPAESRVSQLVTDAPGLPDQVDPRTWTREHTCLLCDDQSSVADVSTVLVAGNSGVHVEEVSYWYPWDWGAVTNVSSSSSSPPLPLLPQQRASRPG